MNTSRERFWNDDVPSLVFNEVAIKDWLGENVQAACKQQIEELSCHVHVDTGAITLCVCGLEYDDADGLGSIFNKGFDIGEEVNSWLGDYSSLNAISPEQRNDLIRRRKQIDAMYSRWKQTLDVGIAKPSM